MTTIYLIRHAEAEGNLYRVIQGQQDALLTERGKLQVRALAERFRTVPVDAVYTSDLSRAAETAAGICRVQGLPLHRDAGLREICVGSWEGRPLGEIAREAPEQMEYFRKDLIIYTYFHLAADKPLTDALLEKEVKAVAYETIIGKDGSLPCLVPMSEIAGRMAVQEGAKYLEKTYGGRGVLLGGVPGVERGNVVILGGGNAGTNACKIALGMGANVTVLDVNTCRLAYLDDIFQKQITTLYSTRDNVRKALSQADLVVAAVLLKPGHAAPKVIKREDLSVMKPGSVIVDIVVDQGGCTETTRPTTHDEPVFIVDGVVHYCVANIPGAVARTSTSALSNCTLSYGLELAKKGVETACKESAELLPGLNCYGGHCTYKGVADALDIPYVDPLTLI